MIIILEGADCAGKSTFAKELSEKTGYEIVKGSSFEIAEKGADAMFEHMMGLLDKKDIIIDRFFYSNLVYGDLYNYPMMKYSQYLQLLDKMNKKALLVYLNAPTSVLRERMEKRGDDMIKADDLRPIKEKYRDVLHGLATPKMLLQLRTDDSNFKISTSMVTEFVKLQETHMHVHNN
ncbi:thymidylate kinase [Bacillus phage vB_BanS_Nate]|uniref:Thymidylate kinase n=1 Tax=Bacillus phage vB_BanS_Nate TaxID=2894788 RepID=A0AAE8YXU4_9CAUD|nr:thymidylate kinase [Bacillus phage vB_BanS_Nate]UGO50959.1 thymidylate kinase [Bacillus phage vB_BanS_Nate]